MGLRTILEAVGLDEVREWAAGLWPEDPAARLRDKAERSRAKLVRGHALLVRQRRRLEALRQSVAHQVQREDCLSRRRAVVVCFGEQETVALELVAVHGALADQRAQLQHRERRYQARLARLRDLKQALTRLQEKIYRLQVQKTPT
jgi:chromosome segregation ATPase